MLEEASIVLFELVECPFCNLFGNERYSHMHKPFGSKCFTKDLKWKNYSTLYCIQAFQGT
jgi:hypothetical protein